MVERGGARRSRLRCSAECRFVLAAVGFFTVSPTVATTMETTAFVQLLIVALVVTDAAVATAADVQNAVGPACEGKDGAVGICRPIADCPAAHDTIRQGGKPSICVYNRSTPVVCCPGAAPASAPTPALDPASVPVLATAPALTPGTPQLDRSSSERVAARMCTKYGEAVFTYVIPPIPSRPVKLDQCAVYEPSPIVPENEIARANEFPHMALLGYGDNAQQPEWACGGSLISERFVLTAAHCLVSRKGIPKIVRLGERDLNTTNELNKHEDYEVTESILHPEFNKQVYYNDIALLRLAREVTFTASIRPACLHTQKDIGTQKTINSGWGRQDWTTPEMSTQLRKARMPIIKTDDCQKTYKAVASSNRLANGINEETMVCAGSEKGKRDACLTDGGGPLQVLLTSPYCMYSVVGISSFGKPTCSPPWVYTRVSHYVPWIKRVVWTNEK